VEREADIDETDLLESLLDGELSPAEAEALGRRLGQEPRLAAELERLRAGRAERRAAIASLEPGDGEAEAVAENVIAAAVRSERLSRAATMARRATAAAAVMALAFAGGWMARGSAAPRNATPVRPVSANDDHPFATSGGGDTRSFPVVVVDEKGNVAVQNFDDPEKAREFANDVGRRQRRPNAGDRPPQSQRYTPVSEPN
jgi:hypothetical protein